jgi:hypothetical protein
MHVPARQATLAPWASPDNNAINRGGLAFLQRQIPTHITNFNLAQLRQIKTVLNHSITIESFILRASK